LGTLTIQAGYSKHRRTDVLPLRKDVAERIRKWIASKTSVRANEPLLRVTNKRTADMLEEDLAAAWEKWIEEAHDKAERQRREQSSFLAIRNEQSHVVDFDSLRMTFITNLTRSGVAPKTAQMLARHSDINLTMNT
jgi:integrase